MNKSSASARKYSAGKSPKSIGGGAKKFNKKVDQFLKESLDNAQLER